MQVRWILVALAVSFPPTSLARADAPEKTRAITIDDYFTQADITQLALAPNGGSVAYTEARWQESTDDRKTELWVVPHGTSKARRLTSDRASYRSPIWSGDEHWIYVLANRKRVGEKKAPWDGKAQVWRVSPEGGELQSVTTVAGGVEAFALTPEGDALYYLVHEDFVEPEWSALRKKFSQLEYGHGSHKVSQLWKLDLDGWRAEKIVDDSRYIHEFTVSPDGKRIAMITAPDEKVVSFEGKSRVDVWEAGKVTTLPDKVWRADAPSPYAWLEKIAWAGDSQALAFNAAFDAYPAQIVVTIWTKGQPKSFMLPRPEGVHIKGYGSPLQWQGRNLYFLGEEKARVRLYAALDVRGSDPGPKFKLLTRGDVVVEGFSLGNQDDRVAVLQASPTQLADIHLYTEGDAEAKQRYTGQQWTRVNPQADAWKLPQLSVVSWKGAKGDLVEGVLELPPDYKEGERVPLVVEIHGGPTTATYYKLQYWIYGRTLLPARGIAVLCPNYRGSTGYGDKFTTDLIGKENDIEGEDILKGVDAMVERGIADPDKLGVSGWSNGGYLTNCLITKTTRFKAAISGAGIVDAIMEFGSNDEPAYALAFKQGFPWNKADKYHKASPTYQLDKIRTPTLIHVGANDDRCPPGHSRMLHRVLREYLQVPTELVVYPGEGHGIMKYRSRRAKLEWDLAWLDRYLLGKKK